MKPVIVSIEVPNPRDEVYAFLDMLGNHEPFTNHMLTRAILRRGNAKAMRRLKETLA